MIAIRPARGEDVAAIDTLLRACFPAPHEANLVRDLCAEGDMVLVLTAWDEEESRVAGMVAFSRMNVEVGGKPVSAVALAPVAVAAAYRRHGVAEALITAGLERLEMEGVVLCFVLGEPEFYNRFGFQADVAQGFETPYAGEFLLALPLQGGLIPCGVRGPAAHAPAFTRLGKDA